MFGLFKRNRATQPNLRILSKDQQFDVDLMLFSSRFANITRYIAPAGDAKLLEDARDDYYSRAPSLAGFGAADLYIHEFCHHIFEATDDSSLPATTSLKTYAMVDALLDAYPPYRTHYVTHIMNLWYEKLTLLGVMPL